MAETKQFLDAEGLKLVKNDYNGKIDKKVSETDLETKVTQKGFAKTNDVVTKDGMDEDLKDYAKSAEVEKDYVKKETGKGLSTNDFDADAKAITDKADATYATKTEVGAKMDEATANSTFVKETEFDGKVKGVVGSVYKPKGSKANYAAIKAVENPEVGDVYNAEDTGANYVYVGAGQGEDQSGWDKLSETVSLDGLAGKDELPEAIPTATIQSILNGTE